MLEIVRLREGDEDVLDILARENAAFEDAAERNAVQTPLDRASAREHLADPNVLHWVATEEEIVVGQLLCYLERRWIGEPSQLLLYEIGVRDGYRRRGVGRALVAEMERWMAAHRVHEVWVLAAGYAEAFYDACGFVRDEEQPVQMSRRL